MSKFFRISCLAVCGWAGLFTSTTALSIPAQDFEQCKQTLAVKAIANGLPAPKAQSIFASIEQSQRVLELDRSQPEFVQTFPGYFGQRVTPWRVQTGQDMLAKHHELLQKLTKQYGIPAQYLVSFWGLETNFGRYKGKMSVLGSLTTLACDPRRSDYFTNELMVALKLLQREKLEPEAMIGSWAGAMGHTQFMPSAYINYAVDGDNDGKIDLWNSEADALTSAANFLANLGWQRGFRWGREVVLPNDFDYSQAGKHQPRTLTEWSELGVQRRDGQPLGEGKMTGFVVIPAGHKGPAFIAYDNFEVILRWNNSEFYAIAVGHLADRIAGGATLLKPLPELPAYPRDAIVQLQQALNQQGFDVGKPDGIMGPATRAGIRQFQQTQQMIADGFPSVEVMSALGINLPADS